MWSEDHGFESTPERRVNFAARVLGEWVEDLVSRVFHEHEDASEWARMACADVGSWWRVDWHEIAEGLVSEVEEGS